MVMCCTAGAAHVAQLCGIAELTVCLPLTLPMGSPSLFSQWDAATECQPDAVPPKLRGAGGVLRKLPCGDGVWALNARRQGLDSVQIFPTNVEARSELLLSKQFKFSFSSRIFTAHNRSTDLRRQEKLPPLTETLAGG